MPATAQVNERSSPHLRNDCRLAAQILTTGQPDPHREWALRTIGPKQPKAAACLVDDREALLTHVDFPAAHWLHLRTTTPVESPFATVRLRPRVTKGAGTRTKGLTMAFKLLAMAEQCWRRLNGAYLLPLVRAGGRFV